MSAGSSEPIEIISAFFEAAADATRYVTALDLICRYLGAASAWLMTPKIGVAAGGLAGLYGGTPLALEAYQTYYHEKDVWQHAAARLGLTGAGSVVTSEQLVPDAQFLQSEFYTDFLLPQGHRHLLSATLADDGDRLPRTVLALFRGEAAGPFDAEAADRLRALLPHLRRGLVLHQQMNETVQRQSVLEAALAGLGFGVVLVTAESEIAFANQFAQRLMQSRDGIGSMGGNLFSTEGSTARDLQAAIQRAAGVAAGRGGAVGAAMRLARLGEKPPLTVIVAPLKTAWPTSLGKRRPGVAIFLFSLDAGTELPLPALMAAFNLTRSEARVLNLLTDGCTVNDVAERLGITTNTVRTHLKHLFNKMGCSRQSDAIRLSLSMRMVPAETALL